MKKRNDAAPAERDRGCRKCKALGTPRNPTINLPRGWRAQLPPAAAYYRHYLDGLMASDDGGHAFAECPLCLGRLRVNISGRKGSWRCAHCRAGGELVSYHMRRNALSFEVAVRDLMLIGRRLSAPSPEKLRRMLAHCVELAGDGAPIDADEAAAFARAKARQHARDVASMRPARVP